MSSLANTVEGTQPTVTETEKGVAELWREVFQTAELAHPADDFFALGGSSIDMVMILFRIQEEFSIQLPDSAIFEAPTLRELSALIDSARAKARNSVP